MNIDENITTHVNAIKRELRAMGAISDQNTVTLTFFGTFDSFSIVNLSLNDCGGDLINHNDSRYDNLDPIRDIFLKSLIELNTKAAEQPNPAPESPTPEEPMASIEGLE